jgi:rhodanese/phosphatase family protein
MDSIFRGDLTTPAGRRIAWLDALFIDHAVFRLFWGNWAAVAPGVLYRCNHPTPGRLAAATRRHGLQTLINLRGEAVRNGADALTREAAARLGLDLIDFSLQSRRAPTRVEILGLAEIYRGMRIPGLIHCKSGADRAGLAAGLFVLVNGGTVDAALRHLALRFGHLSRSSAGVLDAFFLHYRAEAEGRKPFLEWVRQDYDEAALRRDFRARGLARFVNDGVLRRE